MSNISLPSNEPLASTSSFTSRTNLSTAKISRLEAFNLSNVSSSEIPKTTSSKGKDKDVGVADGVSSGEKNKINPKSSGSVMKSLIAGGFGGGLVSY
jgi:hypothetical protein